MSRIKIGFLIVFILLALWAFWPQAEDAEGNIQLGATVASEKFDSFPEDERYSLRIAPDIYLPGLMPLNVGKPLEGMQHVAERFVEIYPDTEIEFVGAPTGVREWLVTQLSAGSAPDIFHVNVEDVWQDIQKGWYVPLDPYLVQPNPFVAQGQPGSEQWWDVFKYQAITRGKAAPDGLLYCISLDMVETGIFYNKDIFRELNLSPPDDWIEFLDVQKKLKEAGYIPLLVHVGQIADWGVDLVFDQLYYPILDGIDLKKDPLREDYMEGYLDWDEISFLYQQGFFSRHDPRYIQLWRILKHWRKYFGKDISTADTTRLFIMQKGAMFWQFSGFVQKLTKDPDIDFDWGVFYPPPIPEEYNKYCDGHSMCVIGGAAVQLCVSNSSYKDTGDPATSERLKRCIAFLQFLTTPENTHEVVNEMTFFLPNIRGVDPRPELKYFDEILRRRYTTTKWFYTFDLKFNEILLRTLELYLNDGISEEDFLLWMEDNMDAAVTNVIRRKDLDLSNLEDEWKNLAPQRKDAEGLPDEPQNAL